MQAEHNIPKLANTTRITALIQATTVKILLNDHVNSGVEDELNLTSVRGTSLVAVHLLLFIVVQFLRCK